MPFPFPSDFLDWLVLKGNGEDSYWAPLLRTKKDLQVPVSEEGGRGADPLWPGRSQGYFLKFLCYFEMHDSLSEAAVTFQETSLLVISEALGRNNWLLMGIRC